MKVLMIGSANLGPYHFSRFQSLAKILSGFTYVRFFPKEVYRPWSSDLGDDPARIISLNRGESISKLLYKESPDIIIIIGYNNWTLLRAARWAKLHGVPCILQCDSTYYDHKRRWWKESVKKFVVRRLFNGAFVAGSRSASYVKLLGISEEFIWGKVDVVDNNHFATVKKSWLPPGRFPKNFFITVARLSKEKNISQLLIAFKLYHQSGGDWGLAIAGAGPLENKLKQSVPDKLTTFIHWFGWAKYNDLPSFYQGASCFILPSISEPWGLAVNEAMAAGLPVLLSKNCGCLPDLCHSGVNGYDFDPMNVEQLSDLMCRMSSGDVDLISMGNESKRLIMNYTPEIWAKTIINMVETLLKEKK
jgi:1,2-diacylglycerol 3-alpha-glucosyltransferase